MDSFSYRPLDLSKNEIRLLILDPFNDSDQVSDRIVHSRLNSRSEQLGRGSDQVGGYEALSYEWGQLPDLKSVAGTSQREESALSSIFLDRKPFGVRWNLYYALRHSDF
jgi:hypothetical protein